VIFKEDGADQSCTSSPHSPDGEGRAHFTTSAQSPPKGVEDGASGAHPPFSLAVSLESTDGSKPSWSNLGSDFSSGPSETAPTQESSMLLALSMPSSSSFTPAATTSADGSPLAHLSGNSIGDPPGNAQSNVDVIGNPHAGQPSFPSKGDVGGPPPVQELAPSGNPPGNSSGDGHPKTSKLRAQGSSCIHDGKIRSASQRQAPQSRGWCRKIFQSGKNRVHPSQGETSKSSPPVAHSSDNQSVSASTNQPLSNIIVFPAGRTGIGGSGSSQDGTDLSASLPPPNLFGTNGKPVRPLPPTPAGPPSRRTGIGGSPRAHLPDNSHEIVPSPAPSLSQELRSAAPPNENPPTSWGVKIGGTNSSKYEDIAFRLLKASSDPRVPNMALLAPVA